MQWFSTLIIHLPQTLLGQIPFPSCSKGYLGRSPFQVLCPVECLAWGLIDSKMDGWGFKICTDLDHWSRSDINFKTQCHTNLIGTDFNTWSINCDPKAPASWSHLWCPRCTWPSVSCTACSPSWPCPQSWNPAPSGQAVYQSSLVPGQTNYEDHNII